MNKKEALAQTAYLRGLGSFVDACTAQSASTAAIFNAAASADEKAQVKAVGARIGTTFLEGLVADDYAQKAAHLQKLTALMVARAEKIAVVAVKAEKGNAQKLAHKFAATMTAAQNKSMLVATEKYADTLKQLQAPTLEKLVRQAYKVKPAA